MFLCCAPALCPPVRYDDEFELWTFSLPGALRHHHHPTLNSSLLDFNIFPFIAVPGIVWFFLKMAFIFYLFSMVKALVPRYRYDQLMRLGWKVFLPISLACVVLTSSFLLFFNIAP